MRWFVDEILWPEAELTVASTWSCATFCKNTKINTTCIFLPLLIWQDYDVLFWYTHCQSVPHVNWGWSQYMLSFLTKTSTPYLLIVKESTATMSVRSWHLYVQYIISGNKNVTLQPQLPLAVKEEKLKIHITQANELRKKKKKEKPLCRKHHRGDLQYCGLAKGWIKLGISVWSSDGHQTVGAIDLW